MVIRGKPVTIERIRKGLQYRALRMVSLAPHPTHKHWARHVMNHAVTQELERLEPAAVDAVEISGRVHSGRPWKSYTTYDFPGFDLCNPPEHVPQFDVVLCEQVLEHVIDPWTAVRTLRDLARPGGHL